METEQALPPSLQPPIPPPFLEQAARLRAALSDLMPDAQILWPQRPGQPLSFRGHLAGESERIFPTLYARFNLLGYTPMLRHHEGWDVITAIPGVPRPHRQRIWINAILFAMTFFSTWFAGVMLEAGEQILAYPRLLLDPLTWLSGLPFAITLLGILGVHEMGHYLAARRHGVDVTLPYFIPMPLSPFGTLGAFIAMRSPVTNRRALLDVGIAGPLAGLLVALPLLIIGLLTSPVLPSTTEGTQLGTSILLEILTKLLRPTPEGYDIYLNSFAFAAWFGLVVTAFNLIPAGQLDGGHISYALLGRFAHPLAIAVCFLIGLLSFFWSGWVVWVLLILLTGWRHPAPLDDVTPLDPKRQALGWIGMALLVLLFVPQPFL